MTLKMSQLIGMEVYTDKADYVGKVYDVIIDLQKGEAARLTLEPIRAASKEEAKRVFKEKTIMYKSVRAVEKIVIVSSQPVPEEPEPEPEPVKKPLPYSHRYKRHF
ncbi:PRC-barrel domain-containing protein [Candidatus Micrarchaeota archaeon]|nr:PRC-barrel domain-containing protein [Candidatus Micrarchaeota archaeon]